MSSMTKDSGAGKCFDEIRAMAGKVCDLVSDGAKAGQPLYDIEAALLGMVLQIGHRAVDAFLKLQGVGDLGDSVATEHGARLTRSDEPSNRTLRTIFGEHEFQQYTYSRGAKQRAELRPIDARLSLSPRVASYLLEEFSQMFCIETAFGQAAANLQRVFGQRLSVDTLEAISQDMGQQAEAYLDAVPTPDAAEEAELLVTTVDAKGIPMITETTERLKAFESRRQYPGNRRMATLAGVYSVDRHVRTAEEIVAALFREDPPGAPGNRKRPKPQHKHLSAHFPEVYDDGVDSVTSTGAIEAFHWISDRIDGRRQSGQPLLLLMDGDHRLWDTGVGHLPEDTVEILDIVHVSAYIWQAANLCCETKHQRELFTRARLLKILEGGVRSVTRGLRCIATGRGLVGKSRKEMARIIGYLEAHADRMRYDEYLRAGYPIATGVIEGACRHMVKDRMERSGMRWTLRGAKAMLNVRAVHQSSHWDEFQAARRQSEPATVHQHRYLLRDYTPLQLAG